MTGIEPVPSAWKAEVLPLNHIRIKWSGRRDSNSRPSPWQGDALPLSHFRILKTGGGRWIRTIESSANGFTVRPLWPLGNPSIFKWSWRRESNSQPADYKSAALPLSHASASHLIILTQRFRFVKSFFIFSDSYQDSLLRRPVHFPAPTCPQTIF